jgi:hypothetical protein
VHTRPGARDDVLATWRSVLGDAWWVGSRDDAIALCLFGAEVRTVARARIGDVVALALGDGGMVERRKLPRLASMPGQHGSVTEAELLVPLLSYGPRI